MYSCSKNKVRLAKQRLAKLEVLQLCFALKEIKFMLTFKIFILKLLQQKFSFKNTLQLMTVLSIVVFTPDWLFAENK